MTNHRRDNNPIDDLGLDYLTQRLGENWVDVLRIAHQLKAGKSLPTLSAEQQKEIRSGLEDTITASRLKDSDRIAQTISAEWKLAYTGIDPTTTEGATASMTSFLEKTLAPLLLGGGDSVSPEVMGKEMGDSFIEAEVKKNSVLTLALSVIMYPSSADATYESLLQHVGLSSSH